jgi:hypothetical protein
MIKCNVCSDMGFIFQPAYFFMKHTETITKACSAKGCYGGWYDVPHAACNGVGCIECSSKETHGIAGKVLCEYCEGKGCIVCHDRGIFRMPCRTCLGSGKVTVTYRPFRKQPVTIPCKCQLQKKEDAVE